MFKLGEVRPPTDADFDRIKEMCDKDDGNDWQLEMEKKNTKVWLKKTDTTRFSLLKGKSVLNDISAELLYSVQMDEDYRFKWDKTLIECSPVAQVSANSFIIKNTVKLPAPFKNRDVVRQTSWLDRGKNKDKFIASHSINHAVSRRLLSNHI